MEKVIRLPALLVLGFLIACTNVPSEEFIPTKTIARTSTPTQSFTLYTDEQALEFMERLKLLTHELNWLSDDDFFMQDGKAFIFLGQLSTLIAQGVKVEELLQEIGIDVASLQVTKRYIGNCLDFTDYQLSPSYELRVDLNVCYGTSISITQR